MKKQLLFLFSFLALSAFTARADEPKPATAPAGPVVTGPSVTQTGDAPKEKEKGDKSAKKKKKKGKKKGAAPADATTPTPATPAK